MARGALAVLAGLAALAMVSQSHAQSRVTGSPSDLDAIITNATIMPPGTYRIAGRAMSCGNARTLLSPDFWDYGGAMPGVIIVNPGRMGQLHWRIRLFVYYHECGHQYVGADEMAADCYAIRRGRREGWLTESGVRRICERLFHHSEGDRYHPPGPARCRMLDQCYADAAPGGDPSGRIAEREIAQPHVDRR